MADSVTYEDIIRTIPIVPAIAFLKKEKVDFPGADADRMIILEVEINVSAGSFMEGCRSVYGGYEYRGRLRSYH
jgi:hypothetical protein